MDARFKNPSPNVILAMMALAGVAIARALLPIEGPADSDFALFLYPWMDSIRHQGLASIAGGFSEYTPPYIYVLNLAALIEPSVGTVAAIKLVNVPFVISCAWGIGAIIRQSTDDGDLGKIGAALILVCPSLLMDSFAHGQCDAIFMSFLIWFVYFAILERPMLAAAMFGLALSFKLQALFVSPLLLTLLLWRRMKLWHFAIIPAVYIVMMVPAAIAGRPWSELLTVYAGQAGVMHELSLNAPNPWWFLHGIVDYRSGVAAGLLAGVTAIALLVWQSAKLPKSASSVLLIAATSAALLPWVLPKMTARYFLLADLLTIGLAFARPGLWPAAVLMQIGSVIAMLAYFLGWGTAGLAIGPTTLALFMLVYAILTADVAHGRSASRS